MVQSFWVGRGVSRIPDIPCRPCERRDPYAAAVVILKCLSPHSSPTFTRYGSLRSQGRQQKLFSRRDAPEVLQVEPCPRKSEGAGKTGCTPHPRSRVQWVDSGRTRAYRFGGITPAFPAQRLYGLYEFAPVTGFLATVIPGKRWLPSRLDASTGASGPHDFTVRSGIVRPHIAARNTIASIATSPNVCDDGRRPSGGKGWREFYGVSGLVAEAECFSREDWTGGIALIGLRKLVWGRNA